MIIDDDRPNDGATLIFTGVVLIVIGFVAAINATAEHEQSMYSPQTEQGWRELEETIEQP